MGVQVSFYKPVSLGYSGVQLKIRNSSGKHLGDLRIGSATVEWMKGKTQEGNGKKLSLEQLIKLIEDA